MNKWRIVFSKTGMGKYISHLDLLRCFSRAILRSGLPVVYSQGFNPHQKMTFALPLPIGVTSECETVDIQFEDTVSAAEIMEALNRNLPMDMRVHDVHTPEKKAADIVAAEYQMKAITNGAVKKEQLTAFFGSGEILIQKKSKKKGEVTVNLMDFIRAWEVTEITEDVFCLRVVLSAGGNQNLKPELLGQALEAALLPIAVTDWEIHRKQIFCTGDSGVLTVFS